jgi:hypothetical protein
VFGGDILVHAPSSSCNDQNSRRNFDSIQSAYRPRRRYVNGTTIHNTGDM